jgi:hypothetical protein
MKEKLQTIGVSADNEDSAFASDEGDDRSSVSQKKRLHSDSDSDGEAELKDKHKVTAIGFAKSRYFFSESK